MLERFSDQAARATEVARAEADSLGHGHVGTEHLLLGILAEGDNPAADALLTSGATLYGCRQMAAELVGDTSPVRSSGDPPYSERATRALDRASRLALRRRDPLVETTTYWSASWMWRGGPARCCAVWVSTPPTSTRRWTLRW